jgi:hypothetical protein
VFSFGKEAERMGRIIAAGLCVLAVGFTLSWALAQPGNPPRTLPPEITNPQPGQPQPGTIQPVSGTRPEPVGTVGKNPPRMSKLEPTRLNDLQKQMLLSTQRATVWLTRMHGANGRFVPGWLPDLNTQSEGDSYLRQVEAAFTLARAARFSGEAELNARATQALLSLLDETQVEEKSGARFTPLPSAAINRLGAAGLLVAAINELPDPKADLLVRSEQLCVYIRMQARPEGWLSFVDGTPAGVPGNTEEMQTYPGQALYGLQLSQRYKPAPWKDDILKRAVKFYHPWWQANRSLGFLPWQMAAYSEAFSATRDTAYSNCVLEMADWLTKMQYDQIDPRVPLWYGGFKGYAEGKVIEIAPQVNTASLAEALVEAARTAHALGDAGKERLYIQTLERSIQFLMTLQYTDASTQHFADWYRPRLVGGFHASHQDGTLRLEATQQALSALIQTLDHVVIR